MSTEKKLTWPVQTAPAGEESPSMGNWEEKCRRCGCCCYEKVEFEGEIYYTEVPCEKLDLHTRLCTVYADRQRARPGCVALDRHLVRQGFLPADCPYVQGIKDYKAPHLVDDGDDEASG